MARITLVLCCFVGLIAMACSVDIPLNWSKNGVDSVAYDQNSGRKLGSDLSEKEEIDAREFSASSQMTAADVLKRVYVDCVQKGSFACVKPKILAFLSTAMKQERIRLTQDMSIEKTGNFNIDDIKWTADTAIRAEDVIDQFDNFVASHELKIRMPKEISSGELLALVPKFLLRNIPTELHLPLAEEKREENERSFVKKIAIPFLFGLKFNATALIPLALTLIALKTWKALTLGLLSIVLSGAILLFKYTKPKVNYEVVHYPVHPHHHLPPAIEHAQTWEHQPYSSVSRSGAAAQDMAYRAHKK